MKTNLPLLGAVVVLLLATASVIHTQPHTPTNAPPTNPPRADFRHRVAAVGLVEPRSENIAIGSELPGVVAEVLVTAGQKVRRGDPLCRLDTRAREAARRESAAAVAAAEAGVGKARAQWTAARNQHDFAAALTDARALSAEERAHRRDAVATAAAELGAAEAAVGVARAALQVMETDLERSVVTAPVNGEVLQVRVRPGEAVPAGPTPVPWMILGDTGELHLRVDIDEHEAWRVAPGAAAVAEVRGNAGLRARARFVRLEPLVIPKQSLTGDSTERVDTRVLQAIYRIEKSDVPLFVGQQMDVFIEAAGEPAVVAGNGGAQ